MDILEIFKEALLHERKPVSQLTLKNYLSDLRHFANWYETLVDQQLKPENITVDLIELYKTSGGATIRDGKIVGEKISPRSFARYLSSLRKLSTILAVQNLIEQNPFSEVETQTAEVSTDLWHIQDFKDYLYVFGASHLTIKNYVNDIQNFGKWYETSVLPNLSNPLTQKKNAYYINQEILQEYKKRLIDIQGAAPRTINRKLSTLRKYLEFATKQGLLEPEEIVMSSVELENAESKPTFALQELKIQSSEKAGIHFSSFPPLRLLQKTMILPYLLAEEKVAVGIAALLTGKRIVNTLPLSLQQKNNVTSKVANFQKKLRIYELLGIKNVKKEFYAPQAVKIAGYPLHKKIYHHIRFTRPNWYKKYTSYTFTHYLHFALLVIFAAGVGIALYQNFITNKNLKPTFASPVAPSRVLSFQGRLTDNFDNPITTATNIRFAIYNNVSASGAALLWQEVQYSVAPDQDGIFSIVLGTNTTIPSTVFSDNASTWLGVTIGSTAELTPRQRIASVAYATNSEQLQGMPPITAGGAGTSNVILALDSSGNLTIGGSANPTFSATGGQFKLSGQPLLLTTNASSNGNIQLVPDGIGKIDVQKPLVNSGASGNISPGGVEVNDKFAVLATESAVAAFIVNNNTTGGDIFAASSSGTTRFKLANDGTITDAVYNANGGIFYANASGTFAQTAIGSPGQCLQSIGGGTPTWGTCGTGTSPFSELLGAIVPNNSTEDFLLGGTATTSAKFGVLNINSGTPVASISANSGNNALYLTGDGTLATVRRNNLTIGNSSTYNTTGNVLINPNGTGNVGIGTTAPTQKLDVNGSINAYNNVVAGYNTSIPGLFSGGSIYPTGDAQSFSVYNGGSGTSYIQLFGNTNATPNIIKFVTGNSERARIDALGNVGIGTTTPTALLDVNGTASISGALKLYGTPTIQSTANQTLTLGGDTTGNINLSPINGSGKIRFTNFSTGGGVIFTDTTGTLGQTNAGTTTDCLTGGTTPSFSPCAGAAASAIFWNQTNGLLYPKNSTVDVTLGGQSTASAKFGFLNVNSGTPVASISANSGNIATYLTGDGTLATTNRQSLTIGNSTTYNTTGNVLINPNGTGNVGIGTGTPSNKLSVQISSIGDGFGVVGNTTGTLSPQFSLYDTTTQKGAVGLALGTANYSSIANPNDIVLRALGASLNGNLILTNQNATGNIYFATGSTTNNDTAKMTILNGGNVGIGTTAPTAPLHIAGAYGSNAAAIINQLNSGDIFTASASGTTKFTISNTGALTDAAYTNAGGILYTSTTGLIGQTGIGTGTQCLLGGTTPSFGACTAGSFPSPFRELSGAIIPLNSTEDFLIGGQATTSAKFAVLNINSGTPVASIAGNLVLGSAGGTTRTIGTTAMNNLQLGDANTGGISLAPAGTTALFVQNGGNVGIGTTAPIAPINIVNSAASSQVVLKDSTDGTGISLTPYWPTIDFNGYQIGTSTYAIGTGYVGLLNMNPTTGDFLFITQNNPGTGNLTSNVAIPITIKNGGNVGIGTTAPTALLDVAGAASVGGQLTFRSGTAQIQSTVNQALTVGGNTTGNITLSPGNSILGSNVTPGITNQVDLGTSGLQWRNIYAQNFIGGTTGIQGLWQRTSGSLAPTNITDSLNLGAVATSSALVHLAGTAGENSWINTGNVGIGTTSPSTKLQVTGSAQFGSGTYINIGSTGQLQINPSSGNASYLMNRPTASDYVSADWVTGGNLSTGWSQQMQPSDTGLHFLDRAANITRMYLKTDGNVGIGTTAPTALLDVAGAASVGGVLKFRSGTAQIQSTANQTLTLGGDSTGNIILSPNNGSGNIILSNLTGQNGVLYGTQTTGMLAQATTASTGLCLQSGASAPTWTSCGSVTASNSPFQVLSGAIVPLNSTEDFLIGGQATTSAKFAILNINSGTPIASISANSGNNALYLTGDGTLATTNRGTLTIGNSSAYNTTGNVLINPNGTGSIGINTSSILASVDIRGNLINGGTIPVASISGKTSFAALQIDNSGSGDLISASASGVSNFIVKNNGDVVVGLGGAGKLTAAVIDPYLVQNQKTTGTTTLTFQTMSSSNGDFIYQNQSTELSRLLQAGQLQLPIVGSTAGLVIGGDTQLFRGAANRLDLASGDSLNLVNGSLLTAGTTRIDSSGNGTFTNLTVSGSCTGCLSGSNSPFQVLSGAIVPLNSTLDFLLGSQASSSAKFAILGVNNARGNQTASISGNLVLDASGSLQTTNNQTLTLGGNSTGEINIKPGNGTGRTTNQGAFYSKYGSSVADVIVNVKDALGNNMFQISKGAVEGAGYAAVYIPNGDILNVRNIQGGYVTGSPSTLNLDLGAGNSTAGQRGNLSFNWDIGRGTLIYDGSAATSGLVAAFNQTTDNTNGDNLIRFFRNTSISSGTTGGNASLIVNQTGASTNDIFAASSSGTTKFVIKNDGTASTSGNLVINATGSLQTTNNQTLTIGGNTTGNITLSPGNSILGSNVTPGITNQVDLGTSGLQWRNIYAQNFIGGTTGIQGLWQRTLGSLAPTNITDSLNLGAIATGSALVHLAGTAGENSFINTGNVGIGNTAPTEKLQVTGNGDFSGYVVVRDTTWGVQLINNVPLSLGSSPHSSIGSDGTKSYWSVGTNLASSTGLTLDSSGNLGIGTTGPLSKLDVRGQGIFGVSSGVGYAAPIASNAAEFNISSNSLVTVGESVLGNANPAITLYRTAAGARIGTAARMYLAGSNFDFRIQQGTNNIDYGAETYTDRLTIGSTGNVGITSNFDTITATSLNIGTGTQTALTLGRSGATTSLIGSNITSGGVAYGNVSNTLAFTSLGTSSQCLIGGTTPSFGSCGTGTTGSNIFQQGSGLIFPNNSTLDFAIGGQATTSAKFAILGVSNARGTQTASISGNLVLDAAGSLQTTLNQTLTLGGNTTGDIQFKPGNSTSSLYLATSNGFVGIGTTAPAFKLDVQRNTGVTNGEHPLFSLTDVSDQGLRLGYQADGASVTAGYIRATNSTALRFATSGTINVTGGGTTLSNGGNFGIGTYSPLSALHITRPLTLGATGKALAIFDQIENQDILTASSGGVTKFTVTNGGFASASAGFTVNSAGNLQTTNNNTLTIGGDTTGHIVLMPKNGNGNVGIGNSNPMAQLDITKSVIGDLNMEIFNTSSGNNAAIEIRAAGTGLPYIDFSTGATSINSPDYSTRFIRNSGANGTYDFIQTGTGGFTFNANISTTGNLTGLTGLTLASGAINLGATNGTSSQCITGGTTAAWGSCGSGTSTSPFQQGAGFIFPNNSTSDFLIGGQATTSAKFAVLNINSGTPVASISASSGDIATYLTGDGTLATTNRQTLTIGNSSTYNTTGNVLINPNGTGNVGIGTTAPSHELTVQQDSATNGVADGVGQLVLRGTTNTNKRLALGFHTGNDYGWMQAGEQGVAFRNLILEPNGGVLGIGTPNPIAELHVSRPLNIGANGKALAIFDQIENQDIFAASSSGLTKFVITNNGSIGIGTAFSPTGVIPTAMLQVFSTLGTSPVASISGNTSAPSLLVTQNGSGDLLVASYSGKTGLRAWQSQAINGYPITLDVGPSALGKINAAFVDPPYTIDGLGYSTWMNSMLGLNEEYTGTTVPTYDPAQGAYAYKLDFNNFTYQSDAWVYNRIIDPDISKVRILLTANSRAKTWYKKDGTNRIITLYSDRPVELSYRLSAPRFDAERGKTFTGIAMGLIVPPPTTTGSGINDNNFVVDPYFATLSINQKNGQWVLTDSKHNSINQTEAFSKAIIANIEAGFINAQKIVTNSVNATSGTISNLTGSSINFTQGVFSSITASTSTLGNATANTFSVTTENFSIAGTSLRNYIASIVTQTLNSNSLILNSGNIISPLASIDRIHTNIISPLGSQEVAVQGNLAIKNESNKTVAAIDTQGNASFGGQLKAESVQANSASISGNLATDTLTTSDASIGGTLRANNIVATNIDGLDARIRSIASGSGSLGNYTANSITTKNLRADYGIFEQGIVALGPSTFGSLTATDQISIGGSFVLGNNSINTIGADLEIQPLKQGNINFMAGLVKIDTDGNMNIRGNLNVLGNIAANKGVFHGDLFANHIATNIISPLPDKDLVLQINGESFASTSGKLKVANKDGQQILAVNSRGDLLASGSGQFSKLNFNLVGQALATSDLTATATGSAGYATLKKDKPELTIKNPNVTANSLIYITPFGDTNNKVLYLLRQVPNTETEGGSFTVGISGPVTPRDIQFNWLIVN